MKRIIIPYSIHNANHIVHTLKTIGAFTDLDITSSLKLSREFSIEEKDIFYDTEEKNIEDIDFVLKKMGVIFHIVDI